MGECRQQGEVSLLCRSQAPGPGSASAYLATPEGRWARSGSLRAPPPTRGRSPAALGRRCQWLRAPAKPALDSFQAGVGREHRAAQRLGSGRETETQRGGDLLRVKEGAAGSGDLGRGSAPP